VVVCVSHLPKTELVVDVGPPAPMIVQKGAGIFLASCDLQHSRSSPPGPFPCHRATMLPASLIRGELTMKTILSALVALSVLASVAAPAAALDAKTFYDQQDRAHF
jgi:hypothetical protein